MKNVSKDNGEHYTLELDSLGLHGLGLQEHCETAVKVQLHYNQPVEGFSGWLPLEYLPGLR